MLEIIQWVLIILIIIWNLSIVRDTSDAVNMLGRAIKADRRRSRR